MGNKIKNNYLYGKNKIISNIILGILFLFLVSGIYYFNKDSFNNIISKNFSVFEVNGGNFDLGIKKNSL